MATASTSARRNLWDPNAPLPTHDAPAQEEPERATRAILRTVSEINQTADNTLTELDSQGRRITKVQRDVAHINDRMNSADRIIYEIGSFWGSIVSRFRSEPNTTENAERLAQFEDEHARHMEGYRNTEAFRRGTGPAPNAPPMPVEYTEGDEVDRDLDEIYLAVHDLKRKALHMGESLEEHNRRLDHLNPEIDIATGRVRNARGKVQNLIDNA